MEDTGKYDATLGRLRFKLSQAASANAHGKVQKHLAVPERLLCVCGNEIAVIARPRELWRLRY